MESERSAVVELSRGGPERPSSDAGQPEGTASSAGGGPPGQAAAATVNADSRVFTGSGNHQDPIELTTLGHEHVAATRILATAELEQLLCSVRGDDTLSKIQVPSPDAWKIRFPSLTALPPSQGETRPISVCIATEDIVGPVRNGGIGTTYAALAQMLAAEGHHTTILYLRGKEVETGTLEHWIEHYAAMGVSFVPVPNYAAKDGFRSVADRWLRAPYNMFRYLVEHPTDVVHVSEWRGSGYLSLLAKRQGIAFHNTLFVVKTSSPWMWNRMYGSQPLERLEDITKIYAERKSVELADVVIGGSLHLIRWMLSQGYAVPRERTFVQPNVVDFDHLKPFIGQRSLVPGTRMPIDEIVFFGRLEARKGLFTFCQAVRRLMRQGVSLPPKISFMGKPGAKLTARPDQTIVEYIQSETADWPVEVTILTEFQQQQAIAYLLTGERLAVMPSTIENSSLAVYEAAICGIPFIASDVGGTPELIETGDHTHVLCAPHPIPLAAKLADAIEQGAYIAAASFDNDENLDVWKRFHKDLGGDLRSRLLPVHTSVSGAAEPQRVAVCIYHTGDLGALERTLATLAAQQARPDEVLIAVDAPAGDASAQVQAALGPFNLPCRVVETFDFDAGLAFNALAETATSGLLLFIWEGATLSPEALTALTRIIALCGADVLNFFYREVDPANPDEPVVLKGNLVGSLTEAFFRADLTVQPIFVRRDTFLQVGGFTTDYRVLGYDQEFLSKAQLSGLHCETALVELASVQALSKQWLNERCYDQPTSYFRAIRPQLATVPLALRDLLLMAKGMSAGPSAMKVKRQAGTGAKTEKGIGRVMRAMSGTEVPPLAKIASGAAGSPERRAPASISNLMRLLDAAGGEPETEKPSHGHREPPPRRARPEERQAARPVARQESASRNPLTGRLLFVRDGMAHGWAFDTTAPNKALVVEALSDGAVVSSAPASATLNSFDRFAKPEAVGHGFVLKLFPGWSRAAMRRGSRRLDIRIVGSEVFVARNIEAFSPLSTMSSSPYNGYCEPNAEGVVTGWVWMPSDPERRLDVDVFVGSRFAGRAYAESYREDLFNAGIKSGQYGFHLPLSPAMLSLEGETVSVVVTKTGLPLKRSPLVIRNRRLERSVRDRLGLPASPLIGRFTRSARHDQRD